MYDTFYYLFSSYLWNNLDAEKVPFSKCCNSPVHIELFESGGGKIACSEPNCIASLLTDFALNLQENQTLWKDKYTIAQTTNI